MAMKFEDLRVLQAAEAVADDIWRLVVRWDWFARDVVGKQLAKAADSIGANIAESYGRFHYGEKLQFLYYARGSLFETKYWLNRAVARELMSTEQVQGYVSRLTSLARQLNSFASAPKAQRRGDQARSKAVREAAGEYVMDWISDAAEPLFTQYELEWLETVPQYPIPNT
ncbi:MAG: four helix bundle protein [Anaerolineae bacterium]